MPNNLPEVWLRGPLPGVLPLLQPIAHALLQAREEVATIMADFPDERLAEKPLGLASVASTCATWPACSTAPLPTPGARPSAKPN